MSCPAVGLSNEGNKVVNAKTFQNRWLCLGKGALGCRTTYLEDERCSVRIVPEASSNFCLHPQLLLSVGENRESLLSAMNSEVCRRACSVTERKQTVCNC